LETPVNSRIEGHKPTAIIIATRLEAEPFIKGMDMKETEVRPFSVYMGEAAIIIISGIGKVNAAMATAYACMRFDPVRVLNLGAAGATSESERPGRIFNIEKTVEPDRPHLRTNTPYIQYPDSLQGFDRATLATQDRGIIDQETFLKIAAIADLVDMEGASVVQAAQRFGKGCILFKFVSDTPSHAGKGDIIIRHIKELRGPFCDFILDSVINPFRDAGYINPP
jgi:adenosylhomocysteine nucleosidase